jgi:hypothetical protein
LPGHDASAMTGAEAELHSPMVLREEKKKP